MEIISEHWNFLWKLECFSEIWDIFEEGSNAQT